MVTKDKVLQYPEGAMQRIMKLYDYDDVRMKEAVDILEEWIKKQTHFTKTDFSRGYLEKCILSNKGSIERTKSKLDKLFTLRTLLPQFHDFEDVRNDFKDLFECVHMIPLPKLTDQFYRIFLFKVVENEMFPKVPYIEYYRMLIASFEYIQMHDCSDGYQLIIDYRDINIMSVLPRLNPVELKEFATIILEGHGARIKGIHILTPSKAVDTLLRIIKPLFSAKIANRFQVHGTAESLHKVIPNNLLPKELGGTESTLDKLQDDFIDLLSSKEGKELFREMKEARVNEAFRLNELNSEDMGLPGTFRTLSVD